MSLKRILRHSVVALGASWLVLPAQAETAPVHVRGEVASVTGNAITIATREGKSVSLTLGDAWKIGGVIPATLADIKPGTFIGTANVDAGADNTALEVVVFPEALRGTGEGDYGWDLQANSKMTNAAVESQVESANGPKLTLKYKGGTKTVSIPPGTPIVTIAPSASPSDLKAGAKVFIIGQASADGSRLDGGRIIVGLNGITPPM